MTAEGGTRLLAVMAKEPVAGKVKTRLEPLLSPEQSARLYRCFLEDRLEEMARLGDEVDLAVAYAPPSARAFFTGLTGGSCRLIPQGEGGLSDRLDAVFGLGFSGGFSAVAVIDSDSPDLPRQVVTDAYRLLEDGSDAVFGPALDGGYYLVALKREAPGLFHGIPWSTPEVLTKSLAAARRVGLGTALLRPWRDIDTPADLHAFCRLPAPLPSSPAPARRTRELLEKLRREGVLLPHDGRHDAGGGRQDLPG